MEPGHTIKGRYRIQHEIGRGCFGVVYLVDDLQSGQPRALKILLPGSQSDEGLRQRLRREAKYATQLTSPHTVKVFDCDESADGNVFLVMEYLQGQELTLVLKDKGSLPPQRVARMAEQILDSLQDAHAAGVIHRDLKPSNIFLVSDDNVKVFDFGIAKAARESSLLESRPLTVDGRVLGTPVYMSPEQCCNFDLTPASDLYSLGVVLYEMLIGRPPFDDENPARVMMMHYSEPVPPLPPGIAKSNLGQAIMRALEKKPEARISSAEEFQAAMRGEAPVPRAKPTVEEEAADEVTEGEGAEGDEAKVSRVRKPFFLDFARSLWRRIKSRVGK